MHLSLVSLVPIAAIAVAATIKINAGENGLAFSPNSTTANVGDVIEFHFFGAFHTAVQGDFGTPCQRGSLSSTGFNSGPIKNQADGTGSVFQVTIQNTDPIWYYCGTPSHCQSGMVGVINPPASGDSLTAYQSNAAGTSSSELPSLMEGGVIVPFPAAGSSTSSSEVSFSTSSSTTVMTSSSTILMASSLTTLMTSSSTTLVASSIASSASSTPEALDSSVISRPACMAQSTEISITSTFSSASDVSMYTTLSSYPNATSSFVPGTTTSLAPEWSPLPSNSTSSAASQLIIQLRDRVLRDYERYSTIFCFHLGSTLDCKGPWMSGNNWNNDTLKNHIVENTVIDPSFQCTSDKSYLGAPGTDRVFYGFSAENVTNSLDSVAHHVALFAAGSCSLNDTCATLYNNNTDQMYSDYRLYLNSTFFKYLKTELAKNESFSYCPDSILSSVSMVERLTAYFDGGKEYFGFHNAVFLPGVIESFNATEQLARIAATQYFANNAHKVEGVILNMIFFSYNADETLAKRDEEIYPGCARKEWISKGYCEGVIPPRSWDMDGSVLPMKDRDRMETTNSLSHPLENTGLIRQVASNCPQIGILEGQQLLFETAIALYNDVSIAIAATNVFESIALATALEIEAAPLLATLGITYFAAAAMVNSCDVFQTCNGLPDSLVAVVKIINGALASGKISTFPLVPGLKPIAGYAGAAGSLFTFAMLKIGQSYFKKAEACCATNCAGAVCQQAGLGCVLTFSSQATLDCAAL